MPSVFERWYYRMEAHISSYVVGSNNLWWRKNDVVLRNERRLVQRMQRSSR